MNHAKRGIAQVGGGNNTLVVNGVELNADGIVWPGPTLKGVALPAQDALLL